MQSTGVGPQGSEQRGRRPRTDPGEEAWGPRAQVLTLETTRANRAEVSAEGSFGVPASLGPVRCKVPFPSHG